jgi:hypothetical protein
MATEPMRCDACGQPHDYLRRILKNQYLLIHAVSSLAAATVTNKQDRGWITERFARAIYDTENEFP